MHTTWVSHAQYIGITSHCVSHIQGSYGYSFSNLKCKTSAVQNLLQIQIFKLFKMFSSFQTLFGFSIQHATGPYFLRLRVFSQKKKSNLGHSLQKCTNTHKIGLGAVAP